MRFGRWTLAIGIGAAGFGALAVADDVRAVAGVPGFAAIGILQWIDPPTGLPVALFADPFGRLPAIVQDRIVIGDPGTADFSTGQVPLLVASEVLPAYWEQPCVWKTARRGPAGFAGRMGPWAARDFAGIPATDRRASEWDNGSEARVVWFAAGNGTGSQGRTAPAVVLAPRELHVEMLVEPGRAFDVLSSTDVGGPYAAVSRVISGPDGHLVFTVPVVDDIGFFRLFPL